MRCTTSVLCWLLAATLLAGSLSSSSAQSGLALPGAQASSLDSGAATSASTSAGVYDSAASLGSPVSSPTASPAPVEAPASSWSPSPTAGASWSPSPSQSSGSSPYYSPSTSPSADTGAASPSPSPSSSPSYSPSPSPSYSPSPSPSPASSSGWSSAGGGSSSGASGCVQNPSSPSCSGFNYPKSEAAKDLEAICSEKHGLNGCSLYQACKSKPKSSVGKQPDTCDEFKLLVSICKNDGQLHVKGCSNYASMCSSSSKVAQCSDPGLAYLPDTSATNQLVRSICESIPSTPGCGRCDFDKGSTCPNGLSMYGQLCLDSPSSHGECVLWSKLCSSKGDPSLFVCRFQPDVPVIPGKPSAATRAASEYALRDSAPPPPHWAPASAGSSRVFSQAGAALSLGLAAAFVFGL